MRLVLVICLACFCTATTALAQLTEDDQKHIASHERRVLNLDDMVQRIKKGDIPPRRATIVWQILKHTSEASSHQLGGAVGNSYFLHKDGQSEAVFDANKKLVQDGINDGSYNYFPAATAPLRHLTYDTLPWIELGHSKKDPHSPADRIDAFCGDLFVGLMYALKEGLPEDLIRGDKLNKPGQAEGLAAVLEAIRLGEAESIFDYFDQYKSQTPGKAAQREMVATIKERLAPGLKLLFLHKASPPIDSATAEELNERKYQVVEIHGLSLGVANHFQKLGEAGDDSRKVLVFASSFNTEDPSRTKGLMRIKSIAKGEGYSLSAELEKLELEWREFHNVELKPSLKQIYRLHPLEKQNGRFHLGAGNIVHARIVSNPNPFTLFTYAAESKTHTIFLSLFSPSKKMSEKDYDENKWTFELLTGSVP